MGQAGFRVVGLREIVRGLEQAGLDVEDLKGVFGPLAQEGAQIAGSFVQSRSGTLRAAIRGNRAKSRAVVTAGRSSVPYAGPQNYGWKLRNIAPQRFLQKADERMQPVAIDRLEAGIEDVIRRRGLA
jgi:hypothetical protein